MEEERLPFEIKECLQLMITTVSILFLGSHSLCLNHKIGLYLTEVLTESYFMTAQFLVSSKSSGFQVFITQHSSHLKKAD